MPKSNGQTDLASYALVADRILLFKEAFPQGQIITDLISRDKEEITFRARIYRDPSERRPSATGWASEIIGDGEINEVACLENTETSAVGRALANLGFTASRSRPSVEEILKAERARLRLNIRRQSTGPMMVREASPKEKSASREAIVADGLFLVAELERVGIHHEKVREAKEVLSTEDTSVEKLERVERTLRRWLQEHRQSGGSSAPE